MDKIIINNLLSLYNNYLYRNDTVFTYIDDNLVVLKKLSNTIDNESRHDINNIVSAKYYGCNFIVENIINIWNPHITSKQKILNCRDKYNRDSKLVFTVGKTVRGINEQEEINDGDVVMRDIYYLDYYKTIDVTIYKILNNYITNLNFKGEIYDWDDSGTLVMQQQYY